MRKMYFQWVRVSKHTHQHTHNIELSLTTDKMFYSLSPLNDPQKWLMTLKESSDAEFTFQVGWTLIQLRFKIPFLKSGCSESPVRMTYFCTGPSHDSWLTRLTYLRPTLSEPSELSELQTVRLPSCRLRCRGALLLDVMMNQGCTDRR